MPPIYRRRRILCALVIVIFIGLASRKYLGLIPVCLDQYPGDALWAMAVYLGWRLVWPKYPAAKIMIIALLTAYGVEFSQLYQADWINHIRANFVGHLFLGATFNPVDLLAYTLGGGLCFVCERIGAWAQKYAASKRQNL